MRQVTLRPVLFLTVMGSLLVGGCGPYPWYEYAYYYPQMNTYREGEDYRFAGTVVDAETRQPISGASARLELVRVTGPATDSLFSLFGLSANTLSLDVIGRCSVIDSLGSTGAYPKVNAFYRRHDLENFIFRRRETKTDSAGRFQLQSTERTYKTRRNEAAFQRIVVTKPGYERVSQGVKSTCEEHLQVLTPVALPPTSGGE